MKHRRIWFIILGIVAIGVLVTICNSFILNRGTAGAAAVSELAMDAAAVPPDFDAGEEPETVEADRNASDESSLTPGAGPSPGAGPGAGPSPEAGAPPEEAWETEAVMAGDADGPADAGKEKSGVLSPLETTAAIPFTESAPAGPGAAAGRSSVLLADGGNRTGYRTRLDELDLQIQKMRSSETEATTYSMKTAAENELKLWDSELNNIYNDILTRLGEEETKKLVAAERDWMKERDAKAVEAARKSAGGTLEGLEYTASQAESTRQRAYELADMYELVAE